MNNPGMVVDKFEGALKRSQSTSWDYLPGVIRGAANLTASATDTRYNLFSLNRGGLSNKNYYSNIVSAAGVMPSDQSFLIEGIKFTLSTTDTSATASLGVNEVRQIVAGATFTLLVDGKPKTEGWLLSLSVPLAVWGAGTVAVDIAMNTIAFKSISHNPIGIPPGVSFDVEAIVSTPALGTDTYLVCELVGTRKIRLG